MLQPAEISLRFDRGRTARPRGGDRLPVKSIRDIAGDENAWMFAFGEMPNEKITIRIRLEFSPKSFRVWIVPNGDENAGNGQ